MVVVVTTGANAPLACERLVQRGGGVVAFAEQNRRRMTQSKLANNVCIINVIPIFAVVSLCLMSAPNGVMTP